MRQLLGAVPGAVLSLVAVVATAVAAVLCLVGLWQVLPFVLDRVRRLAERERRRYPGEPLVAGYRSVEGTPGQRLRVVLRDPATRRDLVWAAVHGPTALMSALLAVGVPLGFVNGLLVPFYWRWVPGGVPSSVGYWVVEWWQALLSPAVGVFWGVVAVVLLPRLADAQRRLAAALLAPREEVVLSARVAELSASQAAALEAHGAELRRIERDLHDGTQNRLVAVAMNLGMLERVLTSADGGSAASALPLVQRSQSATADALSGLREVIRSIYPPILGERGLDGALAALVAHCPVPCQLDVEHVPRMPGAVEAAAYFAVAESLTNVAKHSGATEAAVRVGVVGNTLVVEVRDDGRGGARESPGGGLAGIRQRVAAFEGTVTVTSPDGGSTRVRLELPWSS
jgi:signal transduction histidine kinase